MRIVVSGATGFLGRHILDDLLRRDVWVRALVAAETGEAERDAIAARGAEVVAAAPGDAAAWQGAAAEADFAINALQVTVPGRTSAAYDEVNVAGATALLDACARAEVRGVIHLSSTTAYGAGLPPWPVDESWGFRPLTPLQHSLAQAERAVRTYRRRLPIVVLRAAPPFGPGDDGLMAPLLAHFASGRRVPLIAGGRVPVSLVYGPDLARVVWGALAHFAELEEGIYHAKSIDTDWRTIARVEAEVAQRRWRTIAVPRALVGPALRLPAAGTRIFRPPIDLATYLAVTGRPHLIDDTRLRGRTGFAPLFGLRAAIRLTMEAARAAPAGPD